MHTKLIILTSVSLLSIQSLSAHPGPAGHTHTDDWPFGSIILAVLIILASIVIYKKILKTN